MTAQSYTGSGAPRFWASRIRWGSLALCLAISGITPAAAEVRISAVPLASAGNFAILSKAGISTTGNTAIWGNLGVSPIASTAITGFGLILDPSRKFSLSSQVLGKVFAANFAVPTPAAMTKAVGDMQIAYANAAGRTRPNFLNLGAGDIGGRVLTPGLYRWSTGVIIPWNIALSGSKDAVWIFQIAGTLNVASGKKMLLWGGALPKNIFWQVAGSTVIGTTAQVSGNFLGKTSIVMKTGARLSGRALAQTAVTLDANAVIRPAL